VKAFAADHAVPLIEFEAGQDKDAIVATHRARFLGQDGVVVIGVAQEKARAFKAHKRSGPQGGVTFDFTRQSVAVNHYYFYVQDPEWGPAFVKIGTYLPYPIKLCVNGHEWVKQHLRQAGIPFASLDNGFLSCADPIRLQAICDQLGPRDLQQFFDRCRPQGMATDQRAPEREGSLVNVGSLLVPHAQAAKPVQPGECTLNQPHAEHGDSRALNGSGRFHHAAEPNAE